MAEWFLFLPQVRIPVADLVARAQYAEASGFDGVAFIDHLEAPGQADENIWEAMGVATWVAAKTERLRIGHLVLCDGFRHPAVLAKQAVTVSAASGGRFELGLGAGSWPAELVRFGVGQHDPLSRVQQLDRHLELITKYWGDDPDVTQAPLPPYPIPVVLGGTGPRMMELVRRRADWWNLPCHRIDELPRLAPAARPARVSVQQMVGFIGSDADPVAVREVSTRRFGHLGAGLVCGDARALIEHFASLADHGVERFYVWFADFAAPDTLAAFGASVISGFAARAAGLRSAPSAAGRTDRAAPR
jgi:alkanesulfonate monooxygenase SsuD/methylene tetrahydromethanopterin reductase-like flavin-dependent oxidoreductase (luciferase family)